MSGGRGDPEDSAGTALSSALAEILLGEGATGAQAEEPARSTGAARADLHGALDLLLDDADAHGGQLDAPAFWGFVASLAEGRGIAEDLDHAARRTALACAPLSDPAGIVTPSELWRAYQFAAVFHLLGRLSPFEAGPLPDSFNAGAMRAAMENLRAGAMVAPDLFGLMPEASRFPLRARARRILVSAVYDRADRDGLPLTEARQRLLPDNLQPRTWQDWQRGTAKALGVQPRQLRRGRAAERDRTGHDFSRLSPAQLRALWRAAQGLDLQQQ